MKWSKIITKCGEAGVKLCRENKTFFLHSSYNPRKEAENLVKSVEISNDAKSLLIIGIGAGFHIEEFLAKYSELHIIVMEFNYNYTNWAKENLPIVRKLIEEKKIMFIYSQDLYELKNRLLNYLSQNAVELFIHKQSLELIEDQNLKLWFKQIRLVKNSYLNQKEKLEENFNRNVYNNYPGMSHLNKYKECSFFLISAGPSLNKQLPLLKKISKNPKIVIGCVGTSFKLVHEFGIIPDFVMISDASEEINTQFDFEYNTNIPLYFLSTANHNAVSRYKGSKYIIFQEGYGPAANLAKTRNEPLILTGGSVATCLLDLMVKLGAKSVALVGQDLAFTDDQTHATGIGSNKKVIATDTLIEVEDFFRKKTIYTSLNLYSYKKWFENYAKNSNDVDLWNCTEGGAYIQYWKNSKLDLYFKNVVLNIQDV